MDDSPVDLRRHVAAVVDGTLSLDRFQQWFAEAQDDIELNGCDEHVALASRIENHLAEYTSGHIDAQGFRREFSSFAPARTVVVAAWGGHAPRTSRSFGSSPPSTHATESVRWPQGLPLGTPVATRSA